MRAPTRVVVAAACALALAGCPAQPEEPRLGAAPAEPRQVAPEPVPSAPEPAPQVRAATPEAAPVQAAPPAAPTQPAPPAAPALPEQALRQGGVQRVGRRGRIGVQGFDRLRRGDAELHTALLHLSEGQVGVTLELAAGERLELAGGQLEVLEVDPLTQRVRLRWARGVEPSAPLIAEPPPSGPWAAGLYRLASGEVLAVGNVTPRAEASTVSLALYPSDYEQNPMQDFPLEPFARAGQQVGPFQVQALGEEGVTLRRM